MAPVPVLFGFEGPEPAISVEPRFADRLFPYIRYETVWEGTPAVRDDVAVPNVYIVYGEAEERGTIAAAARMAFYLGNWVDDAGQGFLRGSKRRFQDVLCSETELPVSYEGPLIVAGSRNKMVGHIPEGRFASIVRTSEAGRDLLLVGGSDAQATREALRYLGDVRLNFKAGAYRTFFAFVKLRGYLAEENSLAALDLIRSPRGLSACGRNMSLTATKTAEAPPEIKERIRRRNELLYRLLPEAVENRDKAKALSLWDETMETCYACHQPQDVKPAMRRFKPLSSIHAKHQRLTRLDPETGCAVCHKGRTEIRGYD